MSEVVQKHEADQSEKIENENSQNMMIQNNDSNRYSSNNHKNNSAYRKTSKRRQAQQEKAAVLDLFKELLKVVNQKFENAYLSPPKPKLSKPPKMLKTQSVKTTKKQENSKNKKQESAGSICPAANKVQDKPESKEINPVNIPQILSNTNQNNIVPHSSPLILPLYNSNSQFSSHVRKGSESHGHREKSLNEKHQLLKETLKKQIFDNYFVSMKYIIHEDFDDEIQESKQIEQQSKMVDESNEHIVHAKFRKEEKIQKDENFDDFEFMSHEQKMHEELIKNMKNSHKMDIEWKEIIQKAQNEQNKLMQDEDEDSSSSSSEQNQKYPPHSHMPEGHASTTEQFLQQHHPIITTIPLSCQSLPALQHLESNGPENKQLSKSVAKIPQQKISQEDHN